MKKTGIDSGCLAIGAALAQACRKNDAKIAKLPKKQQEKIRRDARKSLHAKMKALAQPRPFMEILYGKS